MVPVSAWSPPSSAPGRQRGFQRCSPGHWATRAIGLAWTPWRSFHSGSRSGWSASSCCPGAATHMKGKRTNNMAVETWLRKYLWRRKCPSKGTPYPGSWLNYTCLLLLMLFPIIRNKKTFATTLSPIVDQLATNQNEGVTEWNHTPENWDRKLDETRLI